MKKLIKIGLIIFIIHKFSSVLSIFTMYGGVYFLSSYDPSLKEKLNEHQANVMEYVELFLANVVAAIDFQSFIKYVFLALIILSFFVGLKMFVREVRHYGRPEQA